MKLNYENITPQQAKDRFGEEWIEYGTIKIHVYWDSQSVGFVQEFNTGHFNMIIGNTSCYTKDWNEIQQFIKENWEQIMSEDISKSELPCVIVHTDDKGLVISTYGTFTWEAADALLALYSEEIGGKYNQGHNGHNYWELDTEEEFRIYCPNNSMDEIIKEVKQNHEGD